MLPISVLDLASIVQGGSAGQALAHSLALARHAERLGYQRFWVAEHHSMPGVASSAPAVLLAHVAAGTRTIRVGAGGVMLPNHAPLVVAEQFGTLAALHPGRVDLGLGRAPGSDAVTARALRRDPAAADTFPDDVAELMRYFEPARPGQAVRAVPGSGTDVRVWVLGSSLFGAQLAAAFGLPFAFASHFAPRLLDEALGVYRARFTPSGRPGALERPHAMAALNVVAADTDDEAALLFTSAEQAFTNIRRGEAGPLPAPSPGFAGTLPPWERAGLAEMLSASVVGGPAAVRRGLAAFAARTGADELIAAAPVWDHAARLRSFEILAAARDALAGERAAA